MMRVKRSNAIVVLMEGDQFVFHNFLGQQTFSANPTALEIIRRLHAWTDLEAVTALLPGYSHQSIERSMRQLIDLGAVIVESSDDAAREQALADSWLWGPLAAAYHFGTRDGAFIAAEDGEAMLREQIKFVPSPPLFTPNTDPQADIALPVRDHYPEPFQTMAARRTNRLMRDEPVELDQVADCFLFSLAITGIMEDPEVMDLPLKMTPSGGGRNPYEGYICARNIKGLAPGVYHYSAIERTLGVVGSTPPPPFATLMAGQDWTSSAAAVVFLVANFDRTMWKYHHPGAYRVTMIEAGHIAQNMILAATKHGLVANPTGAMAPDLVEATLGVGGITQSVVYAIVLGVPA